MTEDEMRMRLKELTSGSIYRDGYFPMLEIARRLGEYNTCRIRRFRDGTDGEKPIKRRIYPKQKRMLAELLMKIECGMITCKITQESRTPRIPWRKSNCKTMTYSDTPKKHIRGVHKLKIGPDGPSLSMGRPSEKKVMPTFMGAFGGENAFSIPRSDL